LGGWTSRKISSMVWGGDAPWWRELETSCQRKPKRQRGKGKKKVRWGERAKELHRVVGEHGGSSGTDHQAQDRKRA